MNDSSTIRIDTADRNNWHVSELAKEVQKFKAEGLSITEISEKVKVPETTIRHLLTDSGEISEQIKDLKAVIETRYKKIEDVGAKIQRQTDHIENIRRERKRFTGLLERWVNQNKNSERRLSELVNEQQLKLVEGGVKQWSEEPVVISEQTEGEIV